MTKIQLKPIGPSKAKSHDIRDLPDLIIGGATFNTQYNENPEGLPVEEMLKFAFSHGLIAIDTSPYYGPSEEIIGATLKTIESEHPRDTYFICTKAGRVKLNNFDYSPENVRASVLRSLKRLNTSYLDLVYMHDIEFVDEVEIIAALIELKKLKDEKLINNFGISGYPVDFLYKIALKATKTHDIGPLDCILSYSNMCLQNTILLDYYDRFMNECQLKRVMNGSILSMSLLRSGITHSFHPASQSLKDKCQEIAEYLLANDKIELADLATRFAIREWFNKGSTVLGLSNLKELEVAVQNYWLVKNNVNKINDTDAIIIEHVNKLLGVHLNEVWESGIKHD